MKYYARKNQQGGVTRIIIPLSENFFSDAFFLTLKRFIIVELIQKQQIIPITLQGDSVQIQMNRISLPSDHIHIFMCLSDSIAEGRIISLDAFVDYCKYLRQTYPELQMQEKTVVQQVGYFLQLYQSTLSSVQSVDTNLFYAVNAANIIKMAYVKNKTAVVFHDLGTTALAIGFVIWRLFQWNLSLLGQLFFIALFQWIITKASNKIQNSFINSLFSFASQLLLSTIFFSYSAYQSLSSGTPISQAIAAPRYGLNLIAQLIPECFRILIRMAYINTFSFGMKNCLDKKTFEVPAYQSGSMSIAVLSVHFLMPFIDPHLFQLSGFENAQAAEEKLLNFLSKKCAENKDCQFSIENNWFDRMRQYFLPVQTLKISTAHSNYVANCETNITTKNKSATYNLTCAFDYAPPKSYEPPKLVDQGLLPTNEQAHTEHFNTVFSATI